MRTVKIEREELRELYYDRKLSLAQIARHFGVSSSSIYVCMNEYGIPRRTSLEASRMAHEEGRSGYIAYLARMNLFCPIKMPLRHLRPRKT